MLRRFLDVFNRHDRDAIMGFFAADCVLETPRGQESRGRRYVGREAVRGGLAGSPGFRMCISGRTSTGCAATGVSPPGP